MKRTIKSESGRSMVEMLGVLAIIGVLSIGGIAGYTMAMNRFRANEIIDMGNKYASLVFAGNQTLLARTGKGYDKYKEEGGSAVPTVAQFGLVTASGATGNGLPGGGSLEVTDIDDDGVTVKMTFPTVGVCSAGANILGVSATTTTTGEGDEVTTTGCTGNSPYVTHEFRQS